jgi:hypothetical protein
VGHERGSYVETVSLILRPLLVTIAAYLVNLSSMIGLFSSAKRADSTVSLILAIGYLLLVPLLGFFAMHYALLYRKMAAPLVSRPRDLWPWFTLAVLQVVFLLFLFYGDRHLGAG